VILCQSPRHGSWSDFNFGNGICVIADERTIGKRTQDRNIFFLLLFYIISNDVTTSRKQKAKKATGQTAKKDLSFPSAQITKKQRLRIHHGKRCHNDCLSAGHHCSCRSCLAVAIRKSNEMDQSSNVEDDESSYVCQEEEVEDEHHHHFEPLHTRTPSFTFAGSPKKKKTKTKPTKFHSCPMCDSANEGIRY
jgi:hypothetical protein